MDGTSDLVRALSALRWGRVTLTGGMMPLAMTGCIVGPDYRPPELTPPPAFQSTLAPEAVVDRWWTTFNDPALTALVERAVADNLDLAAARSRIAQARAARVQARSNGQPQLTGEASVLSQRLSENGAQLANLPPDVPPELEYEVYNVDFDASWELDLFGRRRRESEAAVARLQSAEEAARDTIVSIVAEVARNYADFRAAERRIAVADETAQSNRRTAELVRLQVAAGEEAGIALNRADSDVLQAEAAVEPLAADRKAALFAIDILIGAQPGGAEAAIAAVGSPAAALVVPTIPTGLPADLLRRRPDVRQAERELAAATADIGFSVADLYPRISLTGTLGLESLRIGDLVDSASRYWTAGPALSLPIFDGGRRQAEVRRQRAEADEALAAYRKAVLTAFADVETALVRFQREQDRAARLEAARNELAVTLDLTQRQYEAGIVSLIDVLDVQRQVTGLDDQVAQASARVVTNAVSLEKALGGGWQEVDLAATGDAPSS